MSNVLQILIEQAQEKAEQCIKAMALTQQKLNQGQEKLNMLESYRAECQSNLHNAGMGGLTGQQLRNQNAFVGKISQAIEQQNAEIEFLTSTLAHQKQQWQNTLAEQRKYEALVEREKQRAMQKEAKRDQKMNDEFAARIHRVQKQSAGENA